MTLILLCGQGNIGKSTYGKKLKAKLLDSVLIRMDECFPTVQDWDKRWVEYISRIQTAIDLQYNYIICDMSQDSPGGRQKTLQHLIFPANAVNLVIIHLRPPLEDLILWTKKRSANLYKQYKDIIPVVYHNYEPATIEEFSPYAFNVITICEIDNANCILLSANQDATQWLVS